jgi:hypothetical protein
MVPLLYCVVAARAPRGRTALMTVGLAPPSTGSTQVHVTANVTRAKTFRRREKNRRRERSRRFSFLRKRAWRYSFP